MVIAPEHPLTKSDKLKNADEVNAYKAEASKKSSIERSANKDKTGVRLDGITAINPITNKEIPIYIKERMKLQPDNSRKMSNSPDNGGENWPQGFEGNEDGVINYHEIMENVEKRLIETAIAKSGGNIKEAGRLLGIPRETLRYRIKKLGMEEK